MTTLSVLISLSTLKTCNHHDKDGYNIKNQSYGICLRKQFIYNTCLYIYILLELTVMCAPEVPK